MTRIILDLNKNLEQNAEIYFEKAKKAKKKINGAESALEKSKKILKELLCKKDQFMLKKKGKKLKERKKEWYEKFRWFISSEGFLCIGGRDATTNEIIIKKYMNDDDFVFHTDISGSPFFVIKAEGKEIGKQSMEEVAQATASFSKAWKLGLSSLEVFYVKPEQVSKKAKSGEYLKKGAFMIYGKTNYLHPNLGLAIGLLKDNRIMCAPLQTVMKHCKKYVEIIQGHEKTSKIAKEIQRKIGGNLDEIIRALPSGGCDIK
jgi:predicted ribosome quality control (RQC) complex YloA/Tae2 family protein